MDIVLGIVVGGYCALIICFAIAWRKDRPAQGKRGTSMMSVIVPVRNEVQNILELLTDLSSQTYNKKDFEVIVVDDDSEDGTAEVVEQFMRQADHQVKLIRQHGQKSYPTPKKRALSEGVKVAAGDIVVTTDGDCRVGKEWLSSIADHFELNGTNFVSGPVVFNEGKNLFERLQQIEFASLIGVGASSIELGYPNICNGANLAFRKEKFQQLNGYHGNGHLASGDDEFLLQKFATQGTQHIKFLKDKRAIIATSAKEGFKEFYHQRKRWTSKLKHHKRWHIKLLSIWAFVVNALLIFSAVSAILGWIDWKWPVALLSVKFLCEAYFVTNILRFFERRFQWFEFLLLSVIHPFYIVLFGIFTNFGTFKWKGRIYHE